MHERRSPTRKSSFCLKLLAWVSQCKVQHANVDGIPWILPSLLFLSYGFCGYIDPICPWSVSQTKCQGHAREVASSHDLGMYDGIVCISGDGVLVRLVSHHWCRIMGISYGESYGPQTSRYTQVTSSPWKSVPFCKGRKIFPVSCWWLGARNKLYKIVSNF